MSVADRAPLSDWSSRRVLVTGATGIVGSWLVKELLARRATVVAMVLDVDPRCELVRSGDLGRITCVYGNLEDYATVERAVGGWEVDTVIHLGAQALVGPAYRAPLATLEANVRGTYHLLEACRLHREVVRSVVIASSDKAYGSSPTLPYTEDTPLRAEHPYDVSKSCADLISLAYAHTYALPITVARCGNIYGGGDLNWSRIVPSAVRSVLRGERPVIRSDGHFVRDYLYVKDAASAYLRLAELTGPELSAEAFNFGADARRTVLELVALIQRMMGRTDLQPDIRNEARAEIREQWLSARKAADRLGWHPAHTLESGLQETITWYRDWFAEHAAADVAEGVAK
jgi:CDP-glucose 4,6-dehydratase